MPKFDRFKINSPELNIKSLKGRLFIASAIILPLVCGLLGWTLDSAHKNSLLKSQKNQMVTQAYALMAAAELEDDTLWLPELVTDDRLNQTSSGYAASIFSTINQKTIWRSASYTDSAPLLVTQQTRLKNDELINFKMVENQTHKSFVLHHAVEWETTDGTLLPFIFTIYQNIGIYQQQIDAFQRTLWIGLIIIGSLLLIAQGLVLIWGLSPLNQVSKDLDLVKDGKVRQLSGQYPKELRELTHSINTLLEHESKQRERHRHKLSDLAHSIKNPVSVISRAAERLFSRTPNDEIRDILEQNDRINQVISYQLSRSVNDSAAPYQQETKLKPIIEKVASAMRKVYLEDSINIELNLEEISIKADEGDLIELVGNLLDNACKYGRGQIKVTALQQDDRSHIRIEDNGPGISESQRTLLLKRGARADETQSGQGIGLAVAEDIVATYQGNIELDKSELGGLKIEIMF